MIIIRSLYLDEVKVKYADEIEYVMRTLGVRGKEAEDALALMAVRIRDFATGEERDRLSRENERLCKEITRLEANCLAREEWREDMIRWMDECHRLADEVKRLKALLGEETP